MLQYRPPHLVVLRGPKLMGMIIDPPNKKEKLILVYFLTSFFNVGVYTIYKYYIE